MRRILDVFLFVSLAVPFASAARADDFLERYSRTQRFRLGHPTAFHSTPDGGTLLFLRSGPTSPVRDLWTLDLETGKERILLSADDLLAGGEEQLSDEEKARRERTRSAARGIASYRISDDGSRLLVPLSGPPS